MKYFKTNLLYIVIVLAINSCKSVPQTFSIYDTVIDNIILTNSNLIERKSELMVSDETIPFSLNDVENDVVAKKYIAGFNVFNKHTQEEERIIEKVHDSLSLLTQRLNENYVRAEPEQVIKQFNSDVKYVLFFSKLKDGHLFAIMLPYSKKVNSSYSFRDLSYGKGYSFLFIKGENEHQIISAYKGEVHYN